MFNLGKVIFENSYLKSVNQSDGRMHRIRNAIAAWCDNSIFFCVSESVEEKDTRLKSHAHVQVRTQTHTYAHTHI